MYTRFFKTFKKLCESKDMSMNAVARELGVSSGSVTAWKNGRTPKYETIEAIAQYFGVDIEDFFLSDGERKREEILESNIRWDGIQLGIEIERQRQSEVEPEIAEYLEMLRNRPECRMLFSLAKGATREDVEKAVAIIEALRKTEGRG